MARITFRLPDELHATVKTLATHQDRSLNDQLIHLLKQAVAQQVAAGTPVPHSVSADGAGSVSRIARVGHPASAG